MSTIRQPQIVPVSLGAATSQGTPTVLKARVTPVNVGGSAIFVISAPPPGCQLILESPDSMRQQIGEGDFIRPGQDFNRFFIRHQLADGGQLLLAVYPPMGVNTLPHLARPQLLPRVRGVVMGDLTVAAATAWKMRLRNTENTGSGRIAYVRSIDLHHFSGGGVVVECRADVDQDLSADAGTDSAIKWANALAGVTPPFAPAVVARTGGAAWADPPAAGTPSYYFSLAPDNGLVFDPPYPLLPQKEIRIQHLTAPGIRCAMSADISGEVVPSIE